MNIYILLAALYNLCLAIYHLWYWKRLDWENDLRSLNKVNRNLMQIMNLRLIYFFLAFALLLAVFNDTLMDSLLGRSLLIMLAAFWIMRATEQVFFFGSNTSRSLKFMALYLFGFVLHALPILTA